MSPFEVIGLALLVLVLLGTAAVGCEVLWKLWQSSRPGKP